MSASCTTTYAAAPTGSGPAPASRHGRRRSPAGPDPRRQRAEVGEAVAAAAGRARLAGSAWRARHGARRATRGRCRGSPRAPRVPRRVPVEHVQPDAGLHRDHRQPVADAVVQVLRHPQLLLGGGRPGALVASMRRLRTSVPTAPPAVTTAATASSRIGLLCVGARNEQGQPDQRGAAVHRREPATEVDAWPARNAAAGQGQVDRAFVGVEQHEGVTARDVTTAPAPGNSRRTKRPPTAAAAHAVAGRRSRCPTASSTLVNQVPSSTTPQRHQPRAVADGGAVSGPPVEGTAAERPPRHPGAWPAYADRVRRCR